MGRLHWGADGDAALGMRCKLSEPYLILICAGHALSYLILICSLSALGMRCELSDPDVVLSLCVCVCAHVCVFVAGRTAVFMGWGSCTALPAARDPLRSFHRAAVPVPL